MSDSDITPKPDTRFPLKMRFEDTVHIENIGEEKPLKTSEPDVQRMMDETIKRVREQSDKIQAAAKPFADKTKGLAESRPVFFTFIAIFTILSLIPVCFFVGFVLSSAVFILGVAAVGICLSMLFVILLASSILLPTLFVISLISLSILSFLLGLFLLHRLYLNIRDSAQNDNNGELDYYNVSKGIKAWLGETAERIPAVSVDLTSLGIQRDSRQAEIFMPNGSHIAGELKYEEGVPIVKAETDH